MSEPKLFTQIKRSRETLRVGDTVEIAAQIYRIVSADATTPVTNPAMDLDAERGDVILNYELEYVRPAPGGAAPPPAKPARPVRKPKA